MSFLHWKAVKENYICGKHTMGLMKGFES